MTRSWDRLIVSDPGLTRLFSAIRATLTVGLTAAILGLGGQRLHVPLSAVFLGANTAMLASVAVNDPTVRAQQITLLLAAFVAAAASVLAVLLADNRVVSDIVLIALFFGSVYAQRFGPRGTELGFLVAMSYFSTGFFGATAEQIPWLIVALFLGLAIAACMRFVLFPERPKQTLHRLRATFTSRGRLLIGTFLSLPDVPTAGSGAALRRAMVSLNEAALAIEAHLANDPQREETREALFDAEVATEHLARIVLRRHEASIALAQSSRDALESLSRGDRTAAAALAATSPSGGSDADLTGGLAEVLDTLARFEASAAASDAPDVRTGAAAPSAPSAHEIRQPHGLLPSTRRAIQFSVAATLAIVSGEALSPGRWYWAPLTVFIVYNGTAITSGQALLRAWTRVLGTILGAGAGILVGNALHGHQSLAWLTLGVLIFIMLYVMAASYSVAVFFITMIIAVLFTLLGHFNDELMLTRLELTLIGATLGGLAATVVLPLPTRDAIRSDTKRVLEAIERVVRASVAADGAAQSELLAATREADRALAQLHVDAQPRLAAVRFWTTEAHLRRRLVLLDACGYFARNLSRVDADVAAPTANGPVRDATLPALAQRVASHVAALSTSLDGTPVTSALPSPDIAPVDEPDTRQRRTLRAIERTVSRLAETVPTD